MATRCSLHIDIFFLKFVFFVRLKEGVIIKVIEIWAAARVRARFLNDNSRPVLNINIRICHLAACSNDA